MQDDRSWAAGLSQEDFAREFRKRHPFYDVIPDVTIYAGSVHKYEYHGIDGINPENLKNDDAPKPAEKEAEEKAKTNEFECKGCGRKFGYKIALAGHARKCKALLNVRI